MLVSMFVNSYNYRYETFRIDNGIGIMLWQHHAIGREASCCDWYRLLIIATITRPIRILTAGVLSYSQDPTVH